VNINFPNRIWLPLYILDRLDGNIHGTSKFQKLVFLLEQEKNFPKFYSYIRYRSGPYSEGLKNDLHILSKNDLINIKVKYPMINVNNYYVYYITNEGTNFLYERIENIRDSLKNNINRLLNAYGSYDPYNLILFIYKSYINKNLRLKNINSRIDTLRDDFDSAFYGWEIFYDPGCPPVSFILGCLQYSQKVLERVTSSSTEKDRITCLDMLSDVMDHIDIFNVVREMHEEGKFECSEECPFKHDKLVELSEYFCYLQRFCHHHKIFPALKNVQFKDIMSSVDFKKLKEKLSTKPIDPEILY